MKIKELFADVISENQKYEFKSVLTPDNPLKWAKTVIGFANSEGGMIFIGVADDGEAFGLSLDEIDRTKKSDCCHKRQAHFPACKVPVCYAQHGQ